MDDHKARCHRGEFNISRYEIAARAAEIRAGWDEETERKRRAKGIRVGFAFPVYSLPDLPPVIENIESVDNNWL